MTKQTTQLVVAQRGRPTGHTEPREKITVVLLERHAAYLDIMSVLIRLRHHKAISRAEIIRAFVEFMIHSNIDFQRFATIEEMVTYLTAYFRRMPNRGPLPLLLESSLFRPKRPQTDAGCEQPSSHEAQPTEVAAIGT